MNGTSGTASVTATGIGKSRLVQSTRDRIGAEAAERFDRFARALAGRGYMPVAPDLPIQAPLAQSLAARVALALNNAEQYEASLRQKNDLTEQALAVATLVGAIKPAKDGDERTGGPALDAGDARHFRDGPAPLDRALDRRG